MKAVLRQVRISSKKANLVAALVRGKKAMDAIDILTFTPKKGALIIKKVIASAVANAETNLKQDKENLFVKEIIVNEGPTYKRSVPVSRGRANPILKRTANVTVKLGVIESEKKVQEPKTKAKKTLKVSTSKSKIS